MTPPSTADSTPAITDNGALAARRRRAADALHLQDEILVVAAGESVAIPGGADQVFPYRSHPEYFWLTGLECPGGILAFDARTGEWTHFAPNVSELEKVWDGRRQEEGTPLAELPAWLAGRRGRPIINLGADLPSLPAPRHDPARSAAMRERFTHARRRKDDAEIALVRKAVAATKAGFAAIQRLLAPGVTERSVQIELETAFFRAGGDRTAYDTIVGGGPNSVVFHFTPSSRQFQQGELVLIDAAAECSRYCADVTRTFPVGGAPSPVHRQLHQLVDSARATCVAMCVPGAEWRDIHLTAARIMAQGLIEMGILKGSAEDVVEKGVMGLFFPHGVGHMVGLGVRDAGGRALGRGATVLPGGINLRVDLPLEPGFLMTVEPGLYFIPALLTDPQRRSKFAAEVNWNAVDNLLQVGGIRLEDNVLVTEAGPVNLTESIP